MMEVEVDYDPQLDSAIQQERATLSRDLALDIDSHDTTHKHPAANLTDSTIILVLDTNILISHLDILQTLFQKCAAAGLPYLCFLLPLIVIRELEGLTKSTAVYRSKSSGKTVPVRVLAANANKWILSQLESHPNVVRAQRKGETPAALGHQTSNDDLVLDAALFWSLQRPSLVGLVSNDTNLRLKALAHGVPALGITPGSDAVTLINQIDPSLAPSLDLYNSSVQSSLPILLSQSSNMVLDEDLSVQSKPFNPTSFLQGIASTISSFLPSILHAHFTTACSSTYEASYLLRSFPSVDEWNLSTCLEILSRNFVTLDYIWSSPRSTVLEEGSAASRWAAAVDPSLERNRNRQLKLVRESIEDLRLVLGRGGNRGEGKSGYALKCHEVDKWRKREWLGFFRDVEVLLIDGKMLEMDMRERVKAEIGAWKGVVGESVAV